MTASLVDITICCTPAEFDMLKQELDCGNLEIRHLWPFRYLNFGKLGWKNTFSIEIPIQKNGKTYGVEIDRYDQKRNDTIHFLHFKGIKIGDRFEVPDTLKAAFRLSSTIAAPVYGLEKKLWVQSNQHLSYENEPGSASYMIENIMREAFVNMGMYALLKGHLKNDADLSRALWEFHPQLIKGKVPVQKPLRDESYGELMSAMLTFDRKFIKKLYKKFPALRLVEYDPVPRPGLWELSRLASDFRGMSKEERFPVLTDTMLAAFLVANRRGIEKILILSHPDILESLFTDRDIQYKLLGDSTYLGQPLDKNAETAWKKLQALNQKADKIKAEFNGANQKETFKKILTEAEQKILRDYAMVAEVDVRHAISQLSLLAEKSNSLVMFYDPKSAGRSIRLEHPASLLNQIIPPSLDSGYDPASLGLYRS